MGKKNGVLTYKPNKMAKGQEKFEREWIEKERRRLKREAEQIKQGGRKGA
jgi:hypothetical protein